MKSLRMKLCDLLFISLYLLRIYETAEPPASNSTCDQPPCETEDFEDPDMFTLDRIGLGLTPDLARTLDIDPVTFYEMKIKFAYRYLLRNQACNYSEYRLLMPDFWEDYFGGTGDVGEIQQFGYRYWNVSVMFEPEETNTTVEGHCMHIDHVEDCTVQKKDQLKREQDLCFAGGLLECSATNTCVCLKSHGTETVRVNHTTGKPDAGGDACFVEEKQRCLIRHYGTPDLKLPCAHHYICDTFTERCQRKMKAY